MLGTVLKQRRISTMRGVELWKQGRVSEMERERERRRDTKDICIMRRKYTLVARRLKTGVELIWFELMPCTSFYSVFRNTPEVSRMFQKNLEYT